MQSVDELIAALSEAPVGTRELGVSVLEAIGAAYVGCLGDIGWVWKIDGKIVIPLGQEARVVTDLNFRLPGMPEGFVEVKQAGMPGEYTWDVNFMPHDSRLPVVSAKAHTEALARIIVQLKAVLAAKEA